jgi:hypothetical protein
MGLNEAVGYGAVALTALATGFIGEQAGLRPAPFFPGLAFAGLGLRVSVLFVRETKGHGSRAPSPQVVDAETPPDGTHSGGTTLRRTPVQRRGPVARSPRVLLFG